MTLTQQILTVVILVAGTALTRFLPFAVFRGKETPRYITYLSQVLPPAVFGMLVVYCLSGSFGLPELLGILVTCLLHLWKRQMLISILGGTVIYMLLVQYVFVSRFENSLFQKFLHCFYYLFEPFLRSNYRQSMTSDSCHSIVWHLPFDCAATVIRSCGICHSLRLMVNRCVGKCSWKHK